MLRSCTIFDLDEKSQMWPTINSNEQMQLEEFEGFFFTFIDNICFANTAAAFSWNIVKHFLAYLFYCLSNVLESGNLRSDFLKKLYKTHNLQELTLNNNLKRRKKEQQSLEKKIWEIISKSQPIQNAP